MKTADEIRQEFLDFFKDKEHAIVPSMPVVPADDPTLLFINAGMNQFKSIFLGTEKAKNRRVVDTQKCIRVSGKHNDLEEVGFDTYHHTFFEMLGNWSFGDYYKREAIEWAWELLTEVWGLEKERIWATVHDTDDEAEKLWVEVTDLPAERVLRFGDKDNFWEMGETGPCGPCSEIHYYTGDDVGSQKAEKINTGDAEYIEIWNLVFIQYNKDSSGEKKELPNKHVDTGLGFERIVAVIQDTGSNYDTDVFKPLIEGIEEITGRKYAGENQPAFRVIADHVRSLGFAIADGVIPSNEGRGYVLRRLLRRAARFGRELGVHEPFIYRLVSTLSGAMGHVFPEITEKADHVASVLKGEEESFGETLDRGIERFERVAESVTRDGAEVIPGAEAFKLYDTYGFPVDLTELMAREKGLTVDLEGFERAMGEQRERSRAGAKFEVEEILPEGVEITAEPTIFLGYDELEAETQITQVIRGEDEEVSLLLKETPFYGESGGQVGDTGVITGDGLKISVKDTQKIGDSHHLHIGTVEEGEPRDGTEVRAEVDGERRGSIRPNHTATHLMHAALREVLGEHVKQAGSLVAPDRLRFDFTHFDKPTEEQLELIERMVNDTIREDIELKTVSTTFEDAKEKGAMALFGEKYGDDVRMVQIGDYSRELCGGTHVNRTGEIGLFVITSEMSVSAGVRRIEAATGAGAFEAVQKGRRIVRELEEKLSVQADELTARVEKLIESRKELEKELSKLKVKVVSLEIGDSITLSDKAKYDITEEESRGYIIKQVAAGSIDEVKHMGDMVREKFKKDESGIAALASEIDGKPRFVIVTTSSFNEESGLTSDVIAKEVGMAAGGGGGGSKFMGSGGAEDMDILMDVLKSKVPNILKPKEK